MKKHLSIFLKTQTCVVQPNQSVVKINIAHTQTSDTGVESALRWTKALYSASIEDVARLQPAELGQLFGQVPVQEMILDPGMTILDVCMKAGCFGRISLCISLAL